MDEKENQKLAAPELKTLGDEIAGPTGWQMMCSTDDCDNKAEVEAEGFPLCLQCAESDAALPKGPET